MTREELINLIVEESLSSFPGNDQESKFKRMKLHIMASARKRGKSGKQFNAYVYGAMRKRGWKPRRERMNETVSSILKTSGKMLRKAGKDYKREVAHPIKSYMRARKYKANADRVIARGDVKRGLEMYHRASSVMKARRPVVAAIPVGYAAGAFLPSPGGAELGAVAAARTARKISRGMANRRALAYATR